MKKLMRPLGIPNSALFAAMLDRQSRGNSQPKPTIAALT